MDAELLDRIKAHMAWEFARTGPPDDFPAFPDIPGGRYNSDEFFELERKHLWNKVWVMAGRAETAPEPGDYFTFDSLGVPLLIVRGADRRLRAFYNTCQHRGAPVVRDACGSSRQLRCQYHSWSYDITTGELKSVPDERDFIGLVKEERCLNQVSCEVWDGWVFVNEDRNAAPLKEWFGTGMEQMAEFHGEELRTVAIESAIVKCNWKVTAEAFLEVYHFKHIHGNNGEAILDNRGASMGLLPHGCSRMITPFSGTACKARGMQDWSDWQHFTVPGFADVDSVSDMVRSTSSAWSFFPNLITPVASYGFPFLLFWPIDKGTTRLDWVHYGPKDWEGDDLPDRWQARLKVFDQIMYEDVWNMEPMQRSLESPAMSGVPINYQERRIWWFNEEVDRVIGPERIPEHLRVPQLLSRFVEQ